MVTTRTSTKTRNTATHISSEKQQTEIKLKKGTVILDMMSRQNSTRKVTKSTFQDV